MVLPIPRSPTTHENQHPIQIRIAYLRRTDSCLLYPSSGRNNHLHLQFPTRRPPERWKFYGSGTSYAGALDGHIVDANTTTALTSSATGTIGNQFQSQISPPVANGRNFIGLFSYNLSELNDFITANTSSSSSVTVTSVSFKTVASGSSVGTSHGNISLFRTDPFNSTANWANYAISNPWTLPYQSGIEETQFRFAGGGSALTTNLAGSSPSTASRVAGNVLTWTNSANFVVAVNHALSQEDKTLYLMAARGLGNADGRLPIHTRTAATADDRPELLINVSVSTSSDWTGGTSTAWNTAGNWTSLPGAGDNVRFNSSSVANLNTVVDANLSLNGILLTTPAGAVSISGTGTLTLGAGGIDLSAATQDLSFSASLVLGDAQTWNVASGRVLGVGGAVTGSGELTIFGAGKAALNGSNILSNGAGAGNLVISGTLDLNGTTQSINGLSGTGVVDNAAAGTASFTIGGNDASGTFSGILRDTGGALSVTKIGSGALTLTGANEFEGGFTNNGSGSITPNHNLAFGTGPVVSNAGTLYATATTTFANTLTLNNSTLRIGGGNSRTITWNGPVTATGSSGISADGSTGGVTLGSTLNIAGATFTSFANGTVNRILGDISGAGGSLSITSGTLLLSGASNTYGGTTTIGSGCFLRLEATGTLPATGDIVINGGGFTIRNTAGWTHHGTITGNGLGSINLNTGTNATLAGPISGVANVNASSTGTNATVSGAISGGANVTVQNAGATLTLSGANAYSGTTSNTGSGTLALGASNTLPDGSNVNLGAGTLNVGTFNDQVGTLDVSAAGTIQIGNGGTLAFADSSAVDWTGGTLNITGNFVSGASVRFGTLGSHLTVDQLALISVNGSGAGTFTLNAQGYLVSPAGFSGWQSANTTTGGLGDDHDNDGVTNGIEYFMYGPVANSDFTSLPGVEKDPNTGLYSVTWTKAGGYPGTYNNGFAVETSSTLTGSWNLEAADPTPGATVTFPAADKVRYTFPTPLGDGLFVRLRVTGP